MRFHHKTSNRRAGRLAPALLPLALALIVPVSASAQATRTWVSGVGDDANPCSRTAPCKTFAGAISKTAVAGEIDVLDPGGFGAVTITKSITIKAVAVAGVLVSGTNGIVVAAGPSDIVTLSGLDINGLNTGLSGVKVLSAGSVRVENSQIYEFTNAGVLLANSSGVTKLQLVNDSIYNNAGDGVLVAPTGTGKGKATLINDHITNNNCGVVAAAYGGTGGNGANCGATTGTGSGAIATITTFGSTIADHTTNSDSTGIFSEGATATNRIGQDNILGNSFGLRTADGGVITSFGNNSVIGNTTNGAPTPPNATQASKHRKHKKTTHRKATHRR
jgi:hypothetical protein